MYNKVGFIFIKSVSTLSPGKNTGVGCHFLLQCMKVKSKSEVTQSCPTLLDPMDCSLPGSSAHGIFQARVLEWVAIAFSGVSHIVSSICACMSIQLCLTLTDPMDCSLPGSSVHGILQARILVLGAIPFSRGSSQPKEIGISFVPCIDRQILYH